MTYLEARATNEMLRAEERRIRIEKLKGSLIDREMAVRTVFSLARQERDGWLSWPARVAAIMAAELGVDPHMMHAVLVDHVRQHLCELADITLNVD
jgi:hypothetical protein